MIDNINQLNGGVNMGLAATSNKVKPWTIYDAKEKKIYNLDHDQFKNILLDVPHKLVSREIYVRGKKTWIDCVLNSEFFK